MTSVGDLFGLLLAGERPGELTQLLTRPAEVAVDEGSVLLAVDNDALLHLLIPAGSARVPEDHRSQGVKMTARKLSTDTGDVRYADLVCDVPRLNRTFEQLVEDIVTRLRATPTNPLITIVKALDEWRALLRTALEGILRDEIVGLIGELEVLGLLAGHNPLAALEGWVGPSGATHDFAGGGTHIEVKTTSSVSGVAVRISNLDQLDSSTSDSLWLAVVHVVESENAPTLDQRLEALVTLGVPREELFARVTKLGYVPGASEHIVSRFNVRSTRWWRVGDDFPGLRRSELPPKATLAIDRVQYDLILGALDEPASQETVAEVLADWKV